MTWTPLVLLLWSDNHPTSTLVQVFPRQATLCTGKIPGTILRTYMDHLLEVAGHGIPAHAPHWREGRVTIGAMYRPGAYGRTGLVILPTTSLILVVKEIRARQTLEFYCVHVILSCFHRQKCVRIEIWLWKVKWGNRKWIKFNKYFCRDECWAWCTIRC